jgi:geranylgeranyl diphosphate synthase type II
MNIEKYILEKKKIIDRSLDKYLPAEEKRPSLIHRAMRYSLFSGGKRVRPILALAAGEVVGGKAEPLLPTVCALELIHTYSLVHDDLPSLDNDDYRRGKLTCHKVYGEAIALLTGDALLSQAFQLIAQNENMRVVREVASAIGSLGMVGGQVMDVESKGKPPEANLLGYIYKHKTASLIRVSLRVGALLGGAKERELSALSSYGENVGLVFQIVDDLLDGGPYIQLYGEKRAGDEVGKLVKKAQESLKIFNEKGETLSALADFLAERKT